MVETLLILFLFQINAVTGKRWSYNDILFFLQKASSFFKSKGVSKGDIMFFHIEQNDIYAILMLAATVYGAVVSGLPHGSNSGEEKLIFPYLV